MGVAVMAYFLMNASGGLGIVFVATVFVLVCGAFAVMWGEAFFDRMIRLIKWL
jgi:hypothetical protein